MKEKINKKIIDSGNQERKERLTNKVKEIEEEHDEDQHRFFANLYASNCSSKELKYLNNLN